MKGMKVKNMGQLFLGLILATAGLAYVFWNLDIIPEVSGSIIGYFDDAVVLVLLWLLYKRMTKKNGK